jgi:hypothetical protein
MHDHATAAVRWLSAHRREITLAIALIFVISALLLAAPFLLVATGIEWKQSRRRKRLLTIALLAHLGKAAVWLWSELCGAPHGTWHPCAQCHRPIEDRSCAAYCSHACRRYARLERDAQANDPRIAERAQRRLRTIRLQKLADENPEWAEVPY